LKIFQVLKNINNLKRKSFLTEKASSDDIKAFKKSSHWKDWVEAFSFLNSLKKNI